MKNVTLKVQANAMTSHEITIPAHEAAIVKLLFIHYTISNTISHFFSFSI
jgi:hypothetical protein